MKYVDTNILIRLLTDDVPDLRKKAQTWVETHRKGELQVPDVIFCEVFFVLENNPFYRLARGMVCKRLETLLESPSLAYSAAAEQALEIAEKHSELDFTDCLLAVYAGNRAQQLLTFDKDLLKILE